MKARKLPREKLMTPANMPEWAEPTTPVKTTIKVVFGLVAACVVGELLLIGAVAVVAVLGALLG